EERDQLLDSLKHYCDILQKEAEAFNADLEPKIVAELKKRREKLAMITRLKEEIEIPLKLDPSAPLMVPVKLKPSIVLKHKKANAKINDPEYLLANDNYELILRFIRHTGRTMEAAPDTFRKFTEEELRDIILAFMNGHFEGAATGETFRRAGKSDICLNYKSRE